MLFRPFTVRLTPRAVGFVEESREAGTMLLRSAPASAEAHLPTPRPNLDRRPQRSKAPDLHGRRTPRYPQGGALIEAVELPRVRVGTCGCVLATDSLPVGLPLRGPRHGR
jgi:hypothetical protein